MFICDRQTNRQTPDYHIRMGETFYLIEKITSPTQYANFASLICSVRRGITKFDKVSAQYIIICNRKQLVNLIFEYLTFGYIV